MKIAVMNFSGNVGKTMLARQLLAPRIEGAREFVIETINASADDGTTNAERFKGKEFGDLLEEILRPQNVIVDVGASNVEEFVKRMSQIEGSHENFDRFVVPTEDSNKQQLDTVNTIQTLAGLGVPAEKIRVLFNRVDIDDANDLPRRFAAIFAHHAKSKLFTLNPKAVIYESELFGRLGALKKTVLELAMDTTDYRAMAQEAKDDRSYQYASAMYGATRRAVRLHRDLDVAYAALIA